MIQPVLERASRGMFHLLFLGALSAPLGAQPSQILDLATVMPADGIVRWVYGSKGQGNLGVPVSGGFDVDGDGFRDTAVGYMRADVPGRNAAGEVNLVFGDGTTEGFLDTSVADADILRLLGAGTREAAGSELWMDDVTGDGLGDLLICRQNHRPGSRIGAGALTILVGGGALRTQAATLAAVDLASPPMGLTLTTFIGANQVDRLGIWVRTGDITGDGIADIVVGADQEDLGGETNRGAVYVIRGGPHLAAGGTIDLASFGTTSMAGHIAKITPPALSTGYHFGATCQIADLNGNGRGEVLVAATLNRAGATITAEGASFGSAQGSGGASDGILYIAWDNNFPSGPWMPGYSFQIDTSPGSRTAIQGAPTPNVNFGEEILGGLDYDNDGAADLFVGDLTGDGTVGTMRNNSGIGYVFYRAASLQGQSFGLAAPPAGLRITRILGPNSGAIGADTAAHGDFDGDSVDDLAFGSPHAAPQGRINAGAVHILFGQPGGWPAELDLAAANFPLASELRIAEIQGAQGNALGDRGDTLCYSAAQGDLDSDGRDDLILNEMTGNGLGMGTIDVGNLIVVGGQALVGASVFVDGFESGNTGDWTAAVGKVSSSAIKPW